MSGTIGAPVLVLGAATEVGQGVAQALLAAGRPVIAVAPDGVALADLRAAAGHDAPLLPLAGSVDSEAAGAALAAAVSRLKRPPDAVVACINCGFRPGRVLDHVPARLAQQIDQDLAPHLVAARHLLPMLAAGGRPATYLILGGPAAEQPWAGYGHASVSAAALRSLVQVLRGEMQHTGVQVRQLAVCSPIRTESNRGHACPEWPNALEVGHRIAGMLAAPPAASVLYLDRRRAAGGAGSPVSA